MSFDMGDTCGSRGEAPRRPLRLGKVPAVLGGVGAIGPASDTSRGVPRRVGTSSCVQDAHGGRGDVLQGGGSSSCPGDGSVAPTASGRAIEAARVAPDAWQRVLRAGDGGGGGGDENGGDAMGAIRVLWVLVAAWMVLGATGTYWDVCIASWGGGPRSGVPATVVRVSSRGDGKREVASS